MNILGEILCCIIEKNLNFVLAQKHVFLDTSLQAQSFFYKTATISMSLG